MLQMLPCTNHLSIMTTFSFPRNAKLNTGLTPVDQMWGGFFAGGNYLLYGPCGSNRELMAHLFLQSGVSQDEPCLAITTSRPKDLRIGAATIGFDAAEAQRRGMLRVLRVKAGPSLDDQTTGQMLSELAGIMRRRPVRRIVCYEFDQLIRFSSINLFEQHFADFLEQTGSSDATLMVVMDEPYDAYTTEVLNIMSVEFTALAHVDRNPDVQGRPSHCISLIPGKGHLRRCVIPDWMFTEHLELLPAQIEAPRVQPLSTKWKSRGFTYVSNY